MRSRIQHGLVISLAVAVLVTTPQHSPASAPPLPTTPAPTTLALPTPQAYLSAALDFIEASALRREKVDWPAIRGKAERNGQAAQQIPDVYPLIVETLSALGDKHSSFRPPVKAVEVTQGKATGYGFLASWPQRIVVSVSTGGPAEAAGLRLGDRIDTVEGRKPQGKNGVLATPTTTKVKETLRLTVTRPASKKPKTKATKLTINIVRGTTSLVSIPKSIELATGAALGGGRIGYLDLPGLLGTVDDQQAYTRAAHDALARLDATPRCGWVVDVRRNRGGWVYPMLAAVGPLAANPSDPTLVGKVNAQRVSEQWWYQAGSIFVRRSTPQTALVANGQVAPEVSGSALPDTNVFNLPAPYQLKVGMPTVAVLQTGLTASAGESVALAFRGRPKARSFGEPSLGLTTFNVPAVLADGALLIVSNAAMTDRTGAVADGPVIPDELIAPDWSHINDEKDPILLGAIAWLLNQPACAGSTP